MRLSMTGAHSYPNGVPNGPGGWQQMPPPMQPKKKRRIGLWITLGIVALFVASCFAGVAMVASSGNDASKSAVQPVPTNTSGGGISSPLPTASDDTGETDVGPAKIGQDGFTYEDGVTLQVLSARRITFSDTATAANEPGVEYVIQVKNGSDKAVPLSDECTVNAAYGNAGEQSEQVFDSAKGYNEGFTTSLAPGRTATAKAAFTLPRNAKKVSVEVTPAFAYSASTFEGTVK